MPHCCVVKGVDTGSGEGFEAEAPHILSPTLSVQSDGESVSTFRSCMSLQAGSAQWLIVWAGCCTTSVGHGSPAGRSLSRYQVKMEFRFQQVGLLLQVTIRETC